MDEERMHDFHMELWNWLAENPIRGKSDWPGWGCEEVERVLRENRFLRKFHCFACISRDNLRDSDDCGSACPILWSRSGMHKNHVYIACASLRHGDSMYIAWNSIFALQDERRALAIQIAEAWGTNTGAVT